MTRAVLDATAAKVDRAGTARYVTELSRALADRMGDRFTTIEWPHARPYSERRTPADRLHTLARDLWWSQGMVERAARSVDAGLLHVPHVGGPVRGRLPLVLTVHDLALLRFPEHFTPWFRRYGTAVLPRLARRATLVLTPSAFTKGDVVERLGIPEDRVHVTPLGVPPALALSDDEGREVRRALGLPERYVLAVGNLEPRKNLPALLAALADARRALRDDPPTLVHAGALAWRTESIDAALARDGIASAVRFLGRVDDRTLAALYAGATVFAYPSRFEGFGIPVLEAMSHGAPVVTSDVSSLPEVAGDAALFVAPDDREALAAAILRLWRDDALRRDLSARGRRRAASFTWDRCAAATAAAYDLILSR